MRDSTVLTFRTTALLVLLAWPELGLEGGSVPTARAQAFVDRDDASVAFEHPAYTPRLSDFDLHPELDPRPIIGILSQPVRAYSNETYFAGSYSSYMRMAGARTMPVRCDSTKAELRDIFSKINGLLVPGVSLLVLVRFLVATSAPRFSRSCCFVHGMYPGMIEACSDFKGGSLRLVALRHLWPCSQ